MARASVHRPGRVVRSLAGQASLLRSHAGVEGYLGQLAEPCCMAIVPSLCGVTQRWPQARAPEMLSVF